MLILNDACGRTPIAQYWDLSEKAEFWWYAIVAVLTNTMELRVGCPNPSPHISDFLYLVRQIPHSKVSELILL